MPGAGGRLRLPSLGTEASGGGSGAASQQQQRVVVMGTARVGKSAIISQFLYERWPSRYRQTVEELHRGEFSLPDGAALTLDILDTAGALHFPAMRALSIATAHAFLLVYAVDDAASWDEVRRLRHQVTFHFIYITSWKQNNHLQRTTDFLSFVVSKRRKSIQTSKVPRPSIILQMIVEL